MSGLKTGTWVLIADGEKALFLENVGDEQDMNLQVIRKEEHENPETSEQGTDRPGRFNDGPTVSRSAVQDTDWHEMEKHRFAKDLADMLYKKAHANKFKQIVLVAAPQVLGDLREKLHSEVKNRVIREIDKTHTNEPVDEIERMLTAEMC
jgi:protein required for attachment to host cells